MFEKEAEEYFRENAYNFDEVTVCRECMEFGYNKANEWHYVKDGDLPNEDVYVYLLFKEDEYPTVARRHLFKEWEGGLKWCWDCKWGSGYTIEADNDRIIAWKEIVLPKESE